MSARLRRKRARRHEQFAARYGCDCDRHDAPIGFVSTFSSPGAELRAVVDYRGRGA